VKRRAETQVPSGAAGLTVLEYLVARFTYRDAAAWHESVGQGRVLLDERTADAETRLQGGESLRYLVPEIPEPKVDPSFLVVHEDDQILVIDKPGNLPCHPAGRFFANTLWALLRQAGLTRPHFVNRLDRETSGLVLVAKTLPAARSCRRQFDAGTVRKLYLAVVEGEFPAYVDADGWIGPADDGTVRKRQRFCPDRSRTDRCAACRTELRGLTSSDGLSLVLAVPRSGRLHQIRATLAAIGYPVVGDKLYARDPTLFLRFVSDSLTHQDRRDLRTDRQALHAWKLALRHPVTGQPVTYSAPVPADLQALCARMNLSTLEQVSELIP
jgi:23S rRNA pseudouridine955/2504/2580 synthase/23S rRNA pseudouridine1911/1915/1917 synthase